MLFTPRIPRSSLATFVPLLLAIVCMTATACGTQGRGFADKVPAADSRSVEESGAATVGTAESRATGPVQPVVGGRDPPTDPADPNARDASAAGASGWTPNAVVERVVDGDTLVAKIGDRSETVRLIGIDTPESVAPTRPVQCFGQEATLYLDALLPEGSEITLVRDVEARDAYDRMLGYIVRSRDGLFVNLELVAAGYAAAFDYPPNDYYAPALARAEAEAVAAGRGLWGACGGPDVPLD